MKIYLFDIKTKRYLSDGEAIFNPENPSNPHIPAYGTTIKPPECGEFEIPYFINGQWEIRPCYYGKNVVDVQNKTVETVYYEGSLKDGWQYVDDETAAEIKTYPDRFNVEDGKLVRMSDEEYSEFLKTQSNEHQAREIKFQLELLDSQAIRPLRAILAGTQTDKDLEKIKEIEMQAKELRINLNRLQ